MRFLLVSGKMQDWEDFRFSEEILNAKVVLTKNMWYGYGGIPLFAYNIELIKQQCEVLSIEIPFELENVRELFRVTKRMLNKNKYYRSGYVVIRILSAAEGIYTIISCSPSGTFTFPFSDTGLLVRFSDLKIYAGNKLNRYSFFNERLWQAAMATINNSTYQQVILLNDQNFVCECAYNNLFIIIGKDLISPSLQSGCHENTLRSFVLKAAEKTGLTVSERHFISKEMLLNSDEVFLASEEGGISRVMGIESVRYLHYYVKEINEALNNLLKAMTTSMHETYRTN